MSTGAVRPLGGSAAANSGCKPNSPRRELGDEMTSVVSVERIESANRGGATECAVNPSDGCGRTAGLWRTVGLCSSCSAVGRVERGPGVWRAARRSSYVARRTGELAPSISTSAPAA
eukprot:Amastigsp_a6848_31.p4 type:complete len:117 gc:universal Amastigsp_a6848_31:532-182(-)